MRLKSELRDLGKGIEVVTERCKNFMRFLKCNSQI